MNTNSVETRLREIAERENKATKGPWRCFQDEDNEMVHVTRHPEGVPNDSCDTLADCFNYSNAQDKANAAFIARSRQDVPWLLALIKKQREALEVYAKGARNGYLASDALNFSPENL